MTFSKIKNNCLPIQQTIRYNNYDYGIGGSLVFTKISKRTISLVVTLVCVAILMSINNFRVSADSQSSSDMDYAISMMSEYGIITHGDFTNSNHSMGPMAIGGNFNGSYVLSDNHRVDFNGTPINLFNDDTYDFVVRGTAGTGTVSYSSVENGITTNYQFAVASAGISLFDYSTSTSTYGSLTSEAVNSIVNFDRIDNGFRAWSNMVDDYCTDTSNTSVYQITQDYDWQDVTLQPAAGDVADVYYFNINCDVFHANRLSVNVPNGSKAIVNFTGTIGQISEFYYAGLPVSSSEDGVWRDSNSVAFNRNVIFNISGGGTIGSVYSGTIIAPDSTFNSTGTTNGFVYVDTFNGQSVESHCANLDGNFTWVPTSLVEVTPTPTVTATPTEEPTMPVTPVVTLDPTVTQEPTVIVTPTITEAPTVEPTVTPEPTVTDTPTPSPTITEEPTEEPTQEPTVKPTATVAPTITEEPTEEPTLVPTVVPTVIVTQVPIITPITTTAPTVVITLAPTVTTTVSPSVTVPIVTPIVSVSPTVDVPTVTTTPSVTPEVTVPIITPITSVSPTVEVPTVTTAPSATPEVTVPIITPIVSVSPTVVTPTVTTTPSATPEVSVSPTVVAPTVTVEVTEAPIVTTPAVTEPDTPTITIQATPTVVVASPTADITVDPTVTVSIAPTVEPTTAPTVNPTITVPVTPSITVSVAPTVSVIPTVSVAPTVTNDPDVIVTPTIIVFDGGPTNTPSPSITGIADGTNILRPNPTVDTSINTTRTNTTNAITATGESSSVITIVAIVLLMASAFVAFSLRKNGRTQEK
jgi:hypothetical protein